MDALPAGAFRRFGTTRLRESGAVSSLQFSRDGKKLASGAGGIVHVWEAGSWRELRHSAALQTNALASFSPDGRSIAVLSPTPPPGGGPPGRILPPQRFLAEYKGYLQADAYGGYDGIYTKGDVVEVACWAHARRKFFAAKDTDGRRSAQMLRFVQRLYAIEDRIKRRIERRLKKNPELTMDQRYDITREARQARSVPILN